jgi:hypothetical protein
MTEGRREPPSASTSSRRDPSGDAFTAGERGAGERGSDGRGAGERGGDGRGGDDGRPEHVGPPPREGPGERVGPLLVEHYRKADGRSLILYREAAESG